MDFTEPSPGLYLAQVFEPLRMKRTKRGLVNLSGRIEILQSDPSDPDLDEDQLFRYAGQKVWWNGYLSIQALRYTFSALRAMGWTGFDLSDTSSVLPQNGGRTFLIELKENEYTDRISIEKVLPYGEDVVQDFDPKYYLSYPDVKRIASTLAPFAQLFTQVEGSCLELPRRKTTGTSVTSQDLPF